MSRRSAQFKETMVRSGHFEAGNSQPGDSCSKSISETVNGSHNFAIKGYSLAKGMGAGKYIASNTFAVGGYDWAIYFYPDGKNPEDGSLYVSVFIALASDGTDVRALFGLTLLDQSGKGKHKVHSHFDRSLESGPYTLKYRGSMWGYKRYFKRIALETSDYIKDDCLSMHCTVGVVRTRVEGPEPFIIPVPPSDLGRCLKEMLECGVGCDIIFQVGDETCQAHKLVLAARSTVFRAQFFGLLGNRDMDKVVIEDIEPSIFKAMLLFIYSDKLPCVHDITGSTSICTSTNMAQHLLAAADRFGLDKLKSLCEAKLSEDISTDSVATTLALAEQHGCLKLKEICLKFAATPSNLREMMQSEGFKHLEEGCPSLLPELLGTIASADANSGPLLTRKRSSSSSVVGRDLPAGRAAAAESGYPDGRSVRRRL